jgi:hypothetical protein
MTVAVPASASVVSPTCIISAHHEWLAITHYRSMGIDCGIEFLDVEL